MVDSFGIHSPNDTFFQTSPVKLQTQKYSQHLLQVLSLRKSLQSLTKEGEERSCISAPANITPKTDPVPRPSRSVLSGGDKNELTPDTSLDGDHKNPSTIDNTNPFSTLSKSETKDGDHLSINEVVFMEYATQQKAIEETPEQVKEKSKLINAIQFRKKEDIKTKATLETFITMPSWGSSGEATVEGGRKAPGKLSTSLEHFKNNVKSTIKTLALILLYLLISLPTYITATIYQDCYCLDVGFVQRNLQTCQELRQYLFMFRTLSLLGHIVFPCTWLFFDKMYSDKLLKTLRLIRDSR